MKHKPKTIVDLLIKKVDVFREKIEITLQYTPQVPNDTSPKGKTECSDTDNDPDGNLPNRGCSFYAIHGTLHTDEERTQIYPLLNHLTQTN